MGRHEEDAELKRDKQERKHREKDRSRDKDKKSRHREKSSHRDEEERRHRDDSPAGRASGAAKLLDAHDAAEREQSTIDADGAAHMRTESPAGKDDDAGRSRHSHKSSRSDPSRRDRDRDADRGRRRDRTPERHRDRGRDRDRRQDRSPDAERERATSRVKDNSALPASGAPAERRSVERELERQSSPPMSAAARDAQPAPAVQESGGEVSMSIEETNKLRISLGLKPLAAENESDKQRKAQQEREALKAEGERAQKAAELAERVKAQKERRLKEEELRKIKTLGAAADDVDDVSAWINKSRALEEKAKAEARAKALKAAQALEEQDDEQLDSEDGDEDEGQALSNAKELAGMRVRHDADELGEGETMILTLADRNILDEHGEVDADKDELENALVIEQKKRDKARRAASKEEHIKPLFGEDGKRRTMLDKYDEEEDTGMDIDEAGAFSSEKAKQQAEIRAKLAAADSAAGAGAQPVYDGKGEYFTQDEMAAMFKPKKKKKKKALRKKEEEEPVDLSFLEAEAASAAAASASADHGSRAQRGAIAEAALEKREQDAAAKQARYQNALEKANYASLALKQEQEQAAAANAEAEAEDEEELQATLARARRAALAKAQKEEAEEKLSVDHVAEEAARRREAERRRAREDQGGEVLTEMAEYVKGVGRADDDDEAAKVKQETSYMGVDDVEEAQASKSAAELKQEAKDSARYGAWVEGDGANTDKDADMEEGEEAEEDPDEALIHEKAIGKGMAAALDLLKERGDLKAPLQWAGRTNDINEAQRLRNEGQLTDVYTGGRQDNHHAAAIERALTQRDEFGNIMTPKERFRNLCYNFHGKDPSKNKKDKRFRKVQEEQERKRRTMSAIGEDHALSRLAAVQEQSATPYLVLSGKVKPGQSSDPRSGIATVEKGALSLAPSLGGGESMTPLTGKRKVEAMLGIKRPAQNGASSMAPPPARKPKAG